MGRGASQKTTVSYGGDFVRFERNGRAFLVSPQDADWVAGLNWYVDLERRSGRVIVRVPDGARSKNRLLHRLLINAVDGLEVDHINGDGLDNRRSNLRLCTRQENIWNQAARRGTRFPFKGVHGDSRRYRAGITVRGVKVHLGSFRTALDAALAYDAAARRYHGAFARLNFPSDGELSARAPAESRGPDALTSCSGPSLTPCSARNTFVADPLHSAHVTDGAR